MDLDLTENPDFPINVNGRSTQETVKSQSCKTNLILQSWNEGQHAFHSLLLLVPLEQEKHDGKHDEATCCMSICHVRMS